jgi:hypothetical protein
MPLPLLPQVRLRRLRNEDDRSRSPRIWHRLMTFNDRGVH